VHSKQKSGLKTANLKFLRPKTAIFGGKKVIREGRDTKKPKYLIRGVGIRRENGVFICTPKKLVDVSRHLVPIVMVSLSVVGEHKDGFNEPKG
jgi:hypothetical protein